MESIKVGIGCILVLCGLFIIGCSWVRQIHNLRARRDPSRRWSSPAPFAGPLLALTGYAMLPVPFSGWAFLLFAIDLDTVVAVAGILYLLATWMCGRDPHGRVRDR